MSSATAPAPPVPLRVVFYQDQEATAPTRMQVSWEQFADVLSNYVEESPCTVAPGPNQCVGAKCPHKSHSTLPENPMAWSPVEIEGLRLDVNVRAITLLTLDFDHLAFSEASKVAKVLARWEHVRHTTHNCRLDNIAFRAILALSRPVHANQWHRFLAAAVEYLGVTVVDQKGNNQPDPTCKNRSRFYYRPSHPKDAPHDAEHVRGDVLDVDEVLAWAQVNVPAVAAFDYDCPALPEELKWDLDSEAVTGLIDAISRSFPPSRRHELALALGGMLRRAGASLEDARFILRKSFQEGGSDDPEARANTVDHTYALTDDSAMTGFTRVCEILGEQEADEVGEFLTQAKNDVLLRYFTRAPEIVTSSPSQVQVSISVDLGVIQDQVRGLASTYSQSVERNDKIMAILIRRLLGGVALAKPSGHGDVETVFNGADRGVGRYKAIGKVMSALAYGLPTTTSWDGVHQIVRASIASIVVEPGDSSWMARAERVFRLKQDEKKAKDFERAQVEIVRREKATLAAYVESGTVPSIPGVPPDGENWRDRLTIGAGGAPASTPHNARIFLRNHPDFCGHLRWNEVAKRVEVMGGPMFQYNNSPPDILVAGIEDHLSNAHGLQVNHLALRLRVVSVARSNPFDPLKSYLRSLVWDGEKRITNWLKTYCGALQEPTEYLEKVGRRWMISLVARGLKPGCKVDNVLVLQGDGGMGKCLGRGTPVLMFDGTVRPVEQVVCGDLLMGPDSKPRRVLTTNVGYGPLRRIVPIKGDSWVCNDAHILTVSPVGSDRIIDVSVADCYSNFNDGQTFVKGDLSKNASVSARLREANIKRSDTREISDLRKSGETITSIAASFGVSTTAIRTALRRNEESVKDIATDYVNKNENVVQIRTGVDFPAQDVPVDPYLTGLWLGDGSVGTSKITSVDREIIEFCSNIAAEYGVKANIVPTKGKPHIFRIEFSTGKDNGQRRSGRNRLLNFVRTLIVGEEKRVPREYLANSRETRLSLLAGLIDTDGHLINGVYEITTEYAGLRDDVLFLARSLGFAAYSKNKVVNGKMYYRMFISGDTSAVPCLLPRKQAATRRQKKNVLHTGFVIRDEGEGEGEFFGFQLDGDGRFLLGDFTVTHNSTVFSVLAGEWFCDTAINLGDKDSRMMAGLYWLCELAECVAFKRAGHDMLKNFFSSSTDKFRPPFGAAFEDSPRRAVFVGTANDDTILSDETGNRKYWPVACKYTKQAIEKLREDRDQLLAEAVSAFDAGEVWHFTYEEICITEQVTDNYMVETVVSMRVREWWYTTAKILRPKSVTTLDVAKVIFEDKPIRDADLQRIGYALKKIGFERRRDGSGARNWRYFATSELISAERLYALPGGKVDEKKEDEVAKSS